ncbi:MAG: sodium:solute symporter family transporter [Planctomycetota bacterium]
MAIAIFLFFVAIVLVLSFYLGSKAKSSSGYFAAGGQIHWGVNGIAFAGDYLSAASFLGICGMIAAVGYDGFLYSIGYLAGWIVALFVVAEPMKRLGKYTFTDALDSKFNNKGIQLAAGISTLIVSMCYLIPQMVGAGTLVEPLLGMPHHWGVVMVGAIVIFIVATAGMASTTYVQFLKGALLIVFSSVVVLALLGKGLTTTPQTIEETGEVLEFYEYGTLTAVEEDGGLTIDPESGYTLVDQHIVKDLEGKPLETLVQLVHEQPLIEDEEGTYTYKVKGRTLRLVKGARAQIKRLLEGRPEDVVPVGGRPHIYKDINGERALVLYDKSVTVGGVKVTEREGKLFVRIHDWWVKKVKDDGAVFLQEAQSKTERTVGYTRTETTVNGVPKSDENRLRQVGSLEAIQGKTGEEAETGSLGPFEYLSTIFDKETVVNIWKSQAFDRGDAKVTVYYPKKVHGNRIGRPGQKFKVDGSPMDKINFVSLMLALFCGTSALPHILIRYYTVPSPAAARKSTIVAIASIGFFYVLTLYLGLGATVNGALNPEDSNMSAPLLARAFGEFLFAVISAIAFATVLGTVSGLIVASSGAVAHDLIDRYVGLNLSDKGKVVVGKLAAFTVGLVAIILGIVFKGMNVSFLVGWAFAVAASANLPAILMILFWKKTTAQGVVASILVGIVSAIGIILMGPSMCIRYGLKATDALIPLDNPGIVSIPLSLITLIIVSMTTQKNGNAGDGPKADAPKADAAG